MHYVTFWKNLQVVAGLEKLAASDDDQVAQRAQPLLARACDELFETVKQAAAEVTHSLLHDGPPAKEAQLARVLLDYREAHRITGEKFAAAPEETAELFQKLVTASFVDATLEEQLEKLSGEEYEKARNVQLLGREYAVNLMRGLFA